ncbi:hypothetical protein ABZ599_15595 [Streptomyces misionensis]|uniref:hypothetical protein n=1 Tax=Streptomyces misionensis TaxID=67331 RepID=UPI0033E5616C
MADAAQRDNPHLQVVAARDRDHALTLVRIEAGDIASVAATSIADSADVDMTGTFVVRR